jgi:hypothetical protein
MAQSGSAPTGWLEVSREELGAALATLHRFASDRDPGDALVGFEGGCMVIRLGGIEVRARARGSWPGEAALRGGFLANFHESLPAGDLVTVLAERARFKIGRVATRCAWHPRIEPHITLPVDARLAHILRLPLEYTAEEIARCGLADVLARAEAERDEILEKAEAVLAPLELTAEALRELLAVWLRRRFGSK